MKVIIETRAVTITLEGDGVTDDQAYTLWKTVHDQLSTRELEAGSTGFQVERAWDGE